MTLAKSLVYHSKWDGGRSDWPGRGERSTHFALSWDVDEFSVGFSRPQARELPVSPSG